MRSILKALAWLKTMIYIVGSFFLFYMGWTTWNSQNKSNGTAKPLSARYQVGFALSASLFNPHALIDTISIIGTNSINFIGQAKIAYTCACILVSFFWFLGLSIAGYYFKRIDKNGIGIKYLNKVSALIIWIVAVIIVWQVFN